MVIVDLRLPPQEERLVDAMLACVSRWGVAKTTLDDVARQAGCSRATIYRVFPGGKDSLIEATVRAEVARFLRVEAAALEQCDALDDLLVTVISTAARHLSQHEALQFLLANEPEVVLPLVVFSRMDHVYAIGASVPRSVPRAAFAQHLGDDEAPRAAEWVARLTVSYVLCPSDVYDLCDPDAVRRLVRTYVLPGLGDPVSAVSQSTSKG